MFSGTRSGVNRHLILGVVHVKVCCYNAEGPSPKEKVLGKALSPVPPVSGPLGQAEIPNQGNRDPFLHKLASTQAQHKGYTVNSEGFLPFLGSQRASSVMAPLVWVRNQKETRGPPWSAVPRVRKVWALEAVTLGRCAAQQVPFPAQVLHSHSCHKGRGPRGHPRLPGATHPR